MAFGRVFRRAFLVSWSRRQVVEYVQLHNKLHTSTKLGNLPGLTSQPSSMAVPRHVIPASPRIFHTQTS